jgi:hypothetical protein
MSSGKITNFLFTRFSQRTTHISPKWPIAGDPCPPEIKAEVLRLIRNG